MTVFTTPEEMKGAKSAFEEEAGLHRAIAPNGGGLLPFMPKDPANLSEQDEKVVNRLGQFLVHLFSNSLGLTKTDMFIGGFMELHKERSSDFCRLLACFRAKPSLSREIYDAALSRTIPKDHRVHKLIVDLMTALNPKRQGPIPWLQRRDGGTAGVVGGGSGGGLAAGRGIGGRGLSSGLGAGPSSAAVGAGGKGLSGRGGSAATKRPADQKPKLQGAQKKQKTWPEATTGRYTSLGSQQEAAGGWRSLSAPQIAEEGLGMRSLSAPESEEQHGEEDGEAHDEEEYGEEEYGEEEFGGEDALQENTYVLGKAESLDPEIDAEIIEWLQRCELTHEHARLQS
mmetsp:Transcript_54312/g.149663  ORF Transcript_54312/g.149663 Transcript_54312/m.149663 type:complete len:341 (+) Transcript_54312:144-1166(+)